MANYLYAPLKLVEGRQVPKFVLKVGKISQARRSTRFCDSETQASNSTANVHSWDSKTMDLLIAYQEEFREVMGKTKTVSLYPKFFQEIEVDDHTSTRWQTFMNNQSKTFDFTELIAGHFEIDPPLKAWIDSCDAEAKEALEFDYPDIFEPLQEVDASNTTKAERWVRFETKLVEYALGELKIE